MSIDANTKERIAEVLKAQARGVPQSEMGEALHEPAEEWSVEEKVTVP
jgi:hypothetical protein